MKQLQIQGVAGLLAGEIAVDLFAGGGGASMREHRFYHRPGNGLVSKAALPREDERPWTTSLHLTHH